MLIRRIATNYPFFRRILFSNYSKVGHLLVKKIQRQQTLVFASGLSLITYSLLHCRQPLILCEDQSTNMADIQVANELYENNKFKEVYEYLLQFGDSEDPEVLWRSVRAHRDRANMVDVPANEKKEIIYKAYEISKRALELGDDNYACHKWYGIMLSQTGDYEGTKAKINKSPEMKKHFERAIELNPADATSHYLIGMWCFSFADLGWVERKVAAVVFGTPPTSTYEEALEHFVAAEELSPSFYSANQLMLGTVYMKMGKKAEAKEWFEKLLGYDAIKEEDNENVKKAKEHLKSL